LIRKSNFELDRQEQIVKDEKGLLDSALNTVVEFDRDNNNDIVWDCLKLNGESQGATILVRVGNTDND